MTVENSGHTAPAPRGEETMHETIKKAAMSALRGIDPKRPNWVLDLNLSEAIKAYEATRTVPEGKADV